MLANIKYVLVYNDSSLLVLLLDSILAFSITLYMSPKWLLKKTDNLNIVKKGLFYHY